MKNLETSFLLVAFVACLLISIVAYSIFVAFGPPSRELRDPFDEHEH